VNDVAETRRKTRRGAEGGNSDEDSQDEKGLSILKGTLDILDLRIMREERSGVKACTHLKELGLEDEADKGENENKDGGLSP
jgi:hypothetical protein